MNRALTKQEIFNKVRDHLLAQGERSVLLTRDYVCAYRGANGLKCAAGVLIADEYYSPSLESDTVGNDNVQSALVASGVPQDALGLVRELQTTHDNYQPVAWGSALVDIAHAWDLTP